MMLFDIQVETDVFKRGSIYDTNFFADINDITILAHSGYTKQLTQKRVVPDDNNGEGPSGTTNLSLIKRGRDDDNDGEDDDGDTHSAKIARID